MPLPTAPSPHIRYHAPYMEWAKTRAAAEFDLAGSNIKACSLDDLPGARDAVDLAGTNDIRGPPRGEEVGAAHIVLTRNHALDFFNSNALGLLRADQVADLPLGHFERDGLAGELAVRQ